MLLQRIGQCANNLGNILFGWNFLRVSSLIFKYEVWNFNSGNYLFTTDTK